MTDTDGLPGDTDGRPAILYLDVDDEITAAAGRVRAAPEGPVAIVLPYGSRLATSRINFRLLARESAGRGRRLSIVAPDASTRALAVSAGLPVFASVAEFESAAARGADLGAPVEPATTPPSVASEGMTDTPRDGPSPGAPGTSGRPPSTTAPWSAAEPRPRSSGAPIPAVGRRRGAALPGPRTALLLGLLTTSAAVVAIGAYVFLPSATIAISPRLEIVGPIQLEIVADPDITVADQANGVIPAQRLTIEVSASAIFAATGKRVESIKATGDVTFQNCDTGRSKTVAAGAIVSTAGGVAFATTTVVSVQRASLRPQFACKTASVGVVAVKAGPDGNVAASTITKVPPGQDSVVLSVTNPAATSGGSSTEFPIVLQGDVDAALVALIQSARTDFLARVADPSQTPEGIEVFEQTAALADPTPTVDPAGLVGTEIASFELGVTATGTYTGVDTAPVRGIAEARLLALVAAEDTLADGSIDIVVGEPTIEGELVRFPVTGRAASVRTFDAETLKGEVLGLPVREARALLEAMGVVEIEVWPDWVTAIPSLDGRVTLTVGEPVRVSP